MKENEKKPLDLDDAYILASDKVANAAIFERIKQINELYTTMSNVQNNSVFGDFLDVLHKLYFGEIRAFSDDCNNQLNRISEEKRKQELDAVANQDYATIISELGITGRIK